MKEMDWLACLPFTGTEKDLPGGMKGLPPGIDVLNLIKSVTVVDDQTESGLNEIPYQNVKHDMMVVHATFYDKRVKAIDPEGRTLLFAEPDGSSYKTREEWYNTNAVDGEPRHTDPLAGWAITRIYLKIRGGGVHSYNTRM